MFKTSQYFAKIFVMRNSIENDRVVKALFYFFFGYIIIVILLLSMIIIVAC